MNGDDFKNRYKLNMEKVSLLEERLSKACLRDQKTMDKHAKKGKMLPRDRIGMVLDEGSDFLELSALAAFGKYGGSAHSAGLVTGVGLVHGREIMFCASDSTINGGVCPIPAHQTDECVSMTNACICMTNTCISMANGCMCTTHECICTTHECTCVTECAISGAMFPETAKKWQRAQAIAMQNRLPCVYLVDGGGANLSAGTNKKKGADTGKKSGDAKPKPAPARKKKSGQFSPNSSAMFLESGGMFFNTCRLSQAQIPQIGSLPREQSIFVVAEGCCFGLLVDSVREVVGVRG